MNRFSLTSLRFRLVLLVLLATIPALGLILYTASEQRQRAVLEVQDNALRLTHLVSSAQESQIESSRTLLTTVTQLPEVHAGGTDACVACSTLFGDLLKKHPSYSNIAAADLAGNVFCQGQPTVELTNVADRSVFRRTILSHDFAVGEYHIGRLVGTAEIDFGYPVFGETGQVEGVVFASLDLNWLNRFMVDAPLPAAATMFVIDQNGAILARYPDPNDRIGRASVEPAMATTITSRREGVTEVDGPDGTRLLLAFTPLRSLPDDNLYVSIGIPKETAFAEADWVLTRNLIALGLVAVLALAATWIGGDLFILRETNVLLTATKRLSAGDLTARTGIRHGTEELCQLARTFDRMAETLEQREVEHAQAEERIRREAFRAASLVRTASRLNAEINLASVLSAVCEETARALNVPSAGVSLYDDKRNLLVHVSDWGLPAEFRNRMRPLPPDEFDRHLRQMGRVAVMPDGPMDGSRSPNKDAGDGSALTAVVARMLREARLVGTLTVYTLGQPRSFSDDDLMLLKGLADQAAQAITNARLHDMVKEEGRARLNLFHGTIRAQEEERNRIARELHDDTVQSLTLLMMDLDLGRNAKCSESADLYFSKSRLIAQETLSNLRRLIADLRPSVLDDLGLVPAITSYGEQRLEPKGIHLQLTGNALERRLPRAIEVALYRIAQEALTNVLKHSEATEVNINLHTWDGHLKMRVHDNGNGFLLSAATLPKPNGNGLGLLGIKERAALLGGELAVQSEPGEGTQIVVTVPLKEEEE
jgi:signal transduction histidine kinase